MAGSVSASPSSTMNWELHKESIQAINEFSVSGKLAYISEIESQAVNFVWSHNDTVSKLKLMSFLGTTLLTLEEDKIVAKATDSNGFIQYAGKPETLIKRMTGMEIPYEHLDQWIKGGVTSNESYFLNNDSTLDSLSYNGETEFNVKYIGYEEQKITVDGENKKINLPSDLQVFGGDYVLKISVSDWNINNK